MNKHLTLLTAASVAAFVGATQALAGGTSQAPVSVSHSHVNFSVEGIHARSNEFSSIVSVTNQTNAATPVYSTASPDELDAKSTWGWAFNLGYTFDDQSDFNISYRNMKEKMNTATHAYSSVSQIISNSGTGYTATTLTSTGASSIGAGGATNRYLAFLSATDTLTEKAEVKYQQLNFDWGHTFKPAAGVYLHPYIGAAWRSVGYKDTVTYASVGAFTSATPTETGGDYIQGTYSLGSGSNLELNSTEVTEISGGNVITASGGTAEFAEANATAGLDNEFSTTNNATYDVTNNAAALPSYNSKFSGFGPRVGMDSMYTFGEYFGVVGGVAMTMPYAKLKVTGTATRFTTRDLASGGALENDPGTVTGVNLQATTGTDTTTISSTDHKFIPEMELHFGVKFANDITMDDDMAYYLELGYRVIQDWSAVKNLNLRGTTTSTTDGLQTSLWGNNGPGYSYSDITNFGPYLKAGITFGT